MNVCIFTQKYTFYETSETYETSFISFY